jgi:hypothetical protein
MAGLTFTLLTIVLIRQVDLIENGDNVTSDSQMEAQDLTPSQRSSLLKSLPADSAPSAAAGDKALNGSDTAVCPSLLESVSFAEMVTWMSDVGDLAKKKIALRASLSGAVSCPSRPRGQGLSSACVWKICQHSLYIALRLTATPLSVATQTHSEEAVLLEYWP